MTGNLLKARLAQGDVVLGSWLNMGSPVATEIAARAGFDWLLVDGEHGPWDIAAITDQLRLLAGFDPAPVVRVPVGEAWILKQVLDIGAMSVMVPMIDTPEQARAVVAATRYPPAGIRGDGAAVARASGYGADAGYVGRANDDICVIVQAESRRALDNIEAIAATDGVDAVFIGPADLAADMGHPGNPGAPEVQAAIAAALARIRGAGAAAGLLEFDPARLARWRAAGATLLGVAGDVTLLSRASRAALAAARAGLEGAATT